MFCSRPWLAAVSYTHLDVYKRQVFVSDAVVGLVGHAIVEVFSDGARHIVAPEKNERLRLDSLPAARVFRLRKSYLGTSRIDVYKRQSLPIVYAVSCASNASLPPSGATSGHSAGSPAAKLYDCSLTNSPKAHPTSCTNEGKLIGPRVT